MSGNTNGSTRKLYRLINIGLAVLALMLLVSPGFAAGPQPQSSQPPPSQAPQAPNATCPPGGQCFADVLSDNPFYAFINRIYQQDLVTGYGCGGAGEPCDAYSRPYYRPVANVTRSQMAKFIDNGRRLPEIHMDVASGPAPIYSRNASGSAIAAYSTSGQALTAQSSSQVAIYAQTGEAAAISGYSTGSTDASYGVYGTGHTGVRGQGGGDNSSGIYGVASGTGAAGVRGFGPLGVRGEGDTPNGSGVYGLGHGVGTGVRGFSSTSDGVFGETDTGNAVYGWSYENTGYAGWFVGNVRITGTCCSMSAATTKIDNPVDPANKYLNQSLVQSPDMTTVINGNVTTGATGEATVSLPEWFAASNGDFRYQLTVLGQFAQAIVAQEVKDNSFAIKTDKPNVKVSWQVTGIRQDPYANAHRVLVEEDKPANEQGKYLHPAELGQPESLGIGYDKGQQEQQKTQKVIQANP
jgi:hypothetical protein